MVIRILAALTIGAALAGTAVLVYEASKDAPAPFLAAQLTPVYTTAQLAIISGACAVYDEWPNSPTGFSWQQLHDLCPAISA